MKRFEFFFVSPNCHAYFREVVGAVINNSARIAVFLEKSITDCFLKSTFRDQHCSSTKYLDMNNE